MKTRREFIKHSAAAGIAFAVSTVRPRYGFGAAAEIDPAVITKFGSSLTGRLILPSDPAYDASRRILECDNREATGTNRVMYGR